MDIKIKGMDIFLKNLNVIKEKLPNSASKQVYKSLKKIEKISKENTPKDTGKLIGSAFVTPLDDIIINGSGNVGYDSEYSLAVHEGSIAHTPPYKPIYWWTLRKINKDPKQAKSIAWAIVRSIQKNGTSMNSFNENGNKGYKFLEKAMLEVLPNLKSEIINDFKKEILELKLYR